MSTRMLIFGESTVHFQCAWLSMTENGYDERFADPQIFSGTVINWSLVLSNQDGNRQVKEKMVLALYREFRTLLQEYHTTSLTYCSDRLPAISGLVSRVAEVIGDTCFSGLLETDLYYGLLWKTPLPATLRFQHVLAQRSSSDTSAPSWSWLCEENQERGYYGVDRFKLHLTKLRSEYKEVSFFEMEGDDKQGPPFPDVTTLNIKSKVLRVVAQSKPLCADGWGEIRYSHSPLGELHTKRDGQYSYIAHCDFDFKSKSEDNGAELQEICSKALLLFTASELQSGNIMLSIPGRGEYRDILQKQVLDASDEVHDEDYFRLLQRNAWGLVIYPVPQTDKYIRIGTFASICYGNLKGAMLFAGTKFRPFYLV